MQQYSAVVARANASAATSTTTAAAAETPPATTAAPSSPTVADSTVVDAAPGASELDQGVTSSSSSADVASSVSSTSTTMPPSSSSPGPFLSPAETGARPKVSTSPTINKDESSSRKKEVTTVPSDDVVNVKGEEQKENPFEALTEDKSKTAEQEEIRKRRLAVFEEQKRRLMNK